MPAAYDWSAGGRLSSPARPWTCRLLEEWCDDHPESYPPTVFHASDSQSTDGSPEEAAGILTRLHTRDGEYLLFNRQLFRISSRFPAHRAARALQLGYQVEPDSRFFIYEASMDFVVRFFEMDTRPVNLR